MENLESNHSLDLIPLSLTSICGSLFFILRGTFFFRQPPSHFLTLPALTPMRLSSGLVIMPSVMAIVAPAAMATVYLSSEQALTAIFSDHKAGDFKASSIRLSGDLLKAVKANTGLPVRDKEYRVWTAADGSQMYVDEVVGKHEFITFGMGVGSDGKVRGVEILEYRETYGGEVRRPEWRKQFKGKRLGDAFKLNGDIMNISGATLSCHSVTDGVKRLLAIKALAK